MSKEELVPGEEVLGWYPYKNTSTCILHLGLCDILTSLEGFRETNQHCTAQLHGLRWNRPRSSSWGASTRGGWDLKENLLQEVCSVGYDQYSTGRSLLLQLTAGQSSTVLARCAQPRRPSAWTAPEHVGWWARSRAMCWNITSPLHKWTACWLLAPTLWGTQKALGNSWCAAAPPNGEQVGEKPPPSAGCW